LAGRFLKTFEPVMKIIPEVRAPERKVGFNEKIFWTGMALIIYLVMSVVPLYGLQMQTSTSAWQVIMASTRGTLMELGIGPIVTAGLILQMLAGSNIIDVDFSNSEDRSLFTGVSKIFSVIFVAFQASAYLVSGYNGTIALSNSIVIFTELLITGITVMLLDEMIQKGWGIGSGISLFILAGVAQTIMLSCFQFNYNVPEADRTTRPFGIIVAIIHSLVSGSSMNKLILSARGWPSITGLLTTIGVFLFVIYVQGMKVELPIAHAQYRGFRGKYPISLLYVSNLPVIFASALFANIILWSQLLWSNYQTSSWASVIGALGRFQTINGTVTPTGGLAYYVTAPTMGFLQVVGDPYRYLIYAAIMIVFCIIFSVVWLEVGGLDPRTVARQLVDSGMQIPGFRRSEKSIETILKKYIPAVTVMGGLIVGLLAVMADFFGAFGTGTGILLSVGIAYQYYQQLMQERVAEMYPGLRRLLGG
jgi:protein transport protein SEC61 subunit alpha